MSAIRAVADASSLIALTQIGLLESLRPLFGDLVVTPTVEREISGTCRPPSWCSLRSPSLPYDGDLVAAQLGAGETETIAMAMELESYSVVIDELRGRHFGRRLGIGVTGTLGLLLEAKRTGVIPLVRPYADALVATRFFAGSRLIAKVLALANEQA